MRDICDAEVHAAIKADPVRWANETTPPAGYEVKPVTADEDVFLEWANCQCGSTLVRPIDVQLRVRP
jgi:hypothetical protein